MNTHDPASATRESILARIGRFVFGLASVAAGILNLIWAEFEPAHQPIQAWSDHIPHVHILSIIAACWLILGGLAITLPRTARWGGASLAALYIVFAAFPLPRLYTAPHFLGYRPSIYVAVLVEIGQQLILAVGAALAHSLSRRAPLSLFAERFARSLFGLCSLDFGLAHLTSVQAVNPMIPAWLPPGASFWTVLTGIAFLLAGLSILSGIRDVLAAQLLGFMLLVFSVLVLAPQAVANPHSHIAWGSNAYNLTAVGATWLFAGWLATRPHKLAQTSRPS